MINNSKVKEAIKILEKQERTTTFKEVELTLDDNSALNEALRCLNCKNSPCKSGCPVGIDIPRFINLISNNDIKEAYNVILEDNLLPSICGRVCPQEKQCESKCVKGKIGEPVAIGRLERYVADKFINEDKPLKEKQIKNKKIAIIGSGPSGLTCAGMLCKNGYNVEIFEALHVAGGVLSYGIPSFRLPRNIIKSQIDNLEKMGVIIHTNVVVGKTLSIDDLFSMGFNAVYISTGAGLPKVMNISGENLPGVMYANEFLTRINLMKAYKEDYDTPICIPKSLVVVGAGNVAMDVARCAVRIGCEKVTVLYRKTEDEMPARRDEYIHAKEEGVNFEFLKTPIEFLDNDGKLNSIRYAKVQLKENSEGKKIFEILENEKDIILANMVVIAIGNSPNKILYENEKNIDFKDNGCIIANDNTKTSRKFVYAGGDVVTGAATVILAMSAGKKAAIQIDKDLS